MPLGAGATRVMAGSVPFQRPLLPFIYEADCQHGKEKHHYPETEMANLVLHECIGNQQVELEIEDDEQDGDEIVAHVELHAGVVEGIESALVGGELFRVRLL